MGGAIGEDDATVVVVHDETVGVDIDAEVLDGQQRETVAADMRRLPFPPASFDGAIAVRPELASGINIRGGVIVHPAVKAALAAG